MNPPPSSQPGPRVRVSGWPVPIRAASALAIGLLLAGVLISCSNVTRTVVIPPAVPGATFVGSKSCADCHEIICRDFKGAVHAQLQAKGTNAVDIGCESCHGAGSVHVEAGGGYGNIINPKKSPSVCFECHQNVRGEFSLPYRHPLLENHLACQDCHDPHKGRAIKGDGMSSLAEIQLCTGCHATQRGPHVFEHEAVREGCSICHRPHGSVNDKLLIQRNATLCLKCHFQQQSGSGQITIGGIDHSTYLRQGTCWSAGCHEAVHGSQVTTSLRY